ncbi:MAG: Gfo/Idh/MocA family oxidoreductase [Flavobacteriales bacterium]|nr:Gfo/Idh/MocA family oxidoreductase [Flavobacteriales bacterium]
MKRRKFIRAGGLLGLGAILPSNRALGSGRTEASWEAGSDLSAHIGKIGIDGSAFDLKHEPITKVRVAVVGVGNRGTSLINMLEWLVKEGHAEITALSDVNGEKISRAMEQVAGFQKTKPAIFTGSLNAWEAACSPDIADLLLICTPWEWHTSMSLHGMRAGLHVASEVPIAYTVNDSLELVLTAEKMKRHCIMLENCCYNEEELWILNMIEEGVFGTLTHAECAYLHDLRVMMLDPTYYEDRWRLKHHLQRDGNLYTTHGLGPVCMYFDILRGDTLTHLVSMSSKEAGLSEAMAADGDEAIRAMASGVACGDVNTTLLKTAQGRSIMLQFDTHSGRPYSRLNKVIGSGAAHYGYPSKLYVDHGPSWSHHWLDDAETAEMRDRYAHPLWTRLSEQVAQNRSGHGGMDFVMMYRLIRCLNLGESLDLNVYDGALWSLVGALSEQSVTDGSARVDIPDLTGGRWKEARRHPVSREL